MAFEKQRIIKTLHGADKHLEKKPQVDGDEELTQKIEKARRKLMNKKARLDKELEQLKQFSIDSAESAILRKLVEDTGDEDLMGKTEKVEIANMERWYTSRHLKELLESLKRDLLIVKKEAKHEIDDELKELKRSKRKADTESEEEERIPVSVDEPEDINEFIVPVIRKNRPGQQARRKLWELKYGKNANHLKPVKREVPVTVTRRDAETKMKRDVHVAPLVLQEETIKETVHPSWEAKKREKEMLKIQKPAGEKIVFDDDSE